MKMKKPLLIQGIVRGLYYEIILLVIFYFSLGVDFIIGSLRDGTGISDLALFFEMWFINIVSSIIDCFLFLIPCLIGGIAIVFFAVKLSKNNIFVDLIIHCLIYITGLFIVIMVTRIKIELYSYDAIVFGFIILTTILFRLVVQKKKKNTITPPTLE